MTRLPLGKVCSNNNHYPCSSVNFDLSESLENFDYRELIQTFLRWLWLIAICLTAAIFAALAYLFKSPPIYAAKTVVQVEQEQKNVLRIEAIQQENIKDLEYLKTIENNFTSRDLFVRLVKLNKLASVSDFFPLGKKDPPYSEKDYLEELSEIIRVKLRRGTRLIDIVVEHHDPKLAKQLAKSLVEEFQRWTLEQKSGVSRVAHDFLKEESDRLKAKVQQSELAIQEYREKTGSVSLEARQNIVVDKLKELNSLVTAANTSRLRMEIDYRQAKQLAAKGEIKAMLSIPSIASDEILMEMQKQLELEEAEFANLKQRYKSKHPKYIQAQSKINELKRSLSINAQTALERLKAKFEASKNSEEALKNSLKNQEKLALELNKKMVGYNTLLREAEADRSMYQNVLNRLKETDVTKDISNEIIRVVESARVLEKPVRPRKALTFAVAIIGGFTLGIFLALFLNSLDTSLHSIEEAERLLKQPVLTAILKHPKPLNPTSGLVLTQMPDSPIAESIRSLRAALVLMGSEKDRKTFLFTSAIPEEGKSFVCTNYAVSLAQQNLNTLLIDADLRRPTVAKYFSITGNVPGLTDCLVGYEKISTVVIPSHIDNLDVIPAGTRVPNPAELLSSANLLRLIEKAMEKYDRVVIDAAPITSVSDALLISRYIQTTCLIVKADKTPRKAIQRALSSLTHANARIGGIVLNCLSPRSEINYHYYHYSSDVG